MLSIDVRNRLAGDVIVVPLSTNLRPLSTHVLIPAGTGGLRQDSMAKCEQITTLEKSLLHNGPLGDPLSDDLLRRVVLAVRRAVGEILPA